MIKPLGQSVNVAIEASKLRESGQARAPVAPVTPPATPAAAPPAAQAERVVTTTAGQVAQQGAPIDMDKIAKIKAAIASGNYPVDPDAIAERMVELDLPRTFN